ncbi:50S ribosomal protein L5 [Candidatus Giovannonibacteria bacterium]|nr:50S ribosomal protein L5 [Candidatus Giovannonibacteria bacterium]
MGLKEKYEKEVIPEMMKKHHLNSPMAVPKIDKVVLNVGIGRVADEGTRDLIAKQLALISGQKPKPCPAKKSIASFKSRQGSIIGLMVTLRGKRMYDFVSRFIRVALPRTRDFRGLEPKSLDSSGNLTLGVREHIVFPEIIGEDVRNVFGLAITFATNSRDREKVMDTLKLLGFPFRS